MSELKFAVVLPARYGSTRFPGKPLADIAGKPLIEWVYRRAKQIPGYAHLVVATDDERIESVVRDFGGNVVRTSADHATGTDRVAEVARTLDTDIVVNLQGDEPVFDPAMVTEMVARLRDEPDVDIATAAHAIASEEDFHNPNIVKVVVDAYRHAIYFSRAPIPHGAVPLAGETSPAGAAMTAPHAGYQPMRHVGVYAFRRDALERFTRLAPTALEKSERLEQLRALENGFTFAVVETLATTIGVDVPDDVKSVAKQIAEHLN